MRVQTAQWVGSAFAALCGGADSEPFFNRAFTSTGFLMDVKNPSQFIKTPSSGFTLNLLHVHVYTCTCTHMYMY